MNLDNEIVYVDEDPFEKFIDKQVKFETIIIVEKNPKEKMKNKIIKEIINKNYKYYEDFRKGGFEFIIKKRGFKYKRVGIINN